MATPLLGASRGRTDEADKRPIRTHGNGGIPDALAGRLHDGLAGGEQGWITETGMRIFIDSAMALFGADEITQVAAFYMDQLLRVSGYNLQIWSGTRETESLIDGYETYEYTGWATYPWEQLGRLVDGDPQILRTPEQWQTSEPWYGKSEPADQRAMPFHREQEYHGYIGQGGKHLLAGPPVSSSAETLSYVGGTEAVPPLLPGLHDDFVTLPGRRCIQAAKGISLIKRSPIVIPVRKFKPEDVDEGADGPGNYRFSGTRGDNGQEHSVTGDIGLHPSADPQFNKALGITDLHSYIFNYEGLHPFAYHRGDYYTPEESEMTYLNQTALVPPFGLLASQMYFDAESFRRTLRIDDRYGEQAYYDNTAGIDLLDDGGVVIYDGFGGEIRMTGGSIHISCPGDVWLKPGRNLNAWAGHDMNLRAKKSIDAIASNGDFRAKAEHNMQLLGGNDTVGGVLIESRGPQIYDFDECGEAVESGGIMLRSEQASVVAWSSSIYLRTGGGDIAGGPIMLDANKGGDIVAIYAATSQNYLGDGVYWHFGTHNEGVAGPTAFIDSSAAGVPGSLCVGDGIIVAGEGIFGGGVVSMVGFAAVECPFVGCLDDTEEITEAINACVQLMYSELPQDVGQALMDTLFTPLFYDAQRPGNDDVISKAMTSLRVQIDYKSENFKIFEDRWQQFGRIGRTSPAQWNENPVLCQGDPTYPFPGKEAFDAGESESEEAAPGRYIVQDLTIFDPTTGRSRDRLDAEGVTSVYASPQYGEQRAVSLNQYTVII